MARAEREGMFDQGFALTDTQDGDLVVGGDAPHGPAYPPPEMAAPVSVR